MTVTIIPYKASCGLNTFTINGMQAYYEDFGDLVDTASGSAPEYGCGCMEFIPYENIKEETLEHYNITETEYYSIIDKLISALYIGKCQMCL